MGRDQLDLALMLIGIDLQRDRTRYPRVRERIKAIPEVREKDTLVQMPICGEKSMVIDHKL